MITELNSKQKIRTTWNNANMALKVIAENKDYSDINAVIVH